MAQENVENLGAFLETWDLEAWRRGEGEMDMWLLDPEVTYEDRTLPDHAGEAYRGHAGVRRATERWLEPFEEWEIHIEQLIDDGDRVIFKTRQQGRGASSGAAAVLELGNIFTLRDGEIVRAAIYGHPEEALEAAGLSE